MRGTDHGRKRDADGDRIQRERACLALERQYQDAAALALGKARAPYLKLVSKAVRYAVDDILAYEQQQHRGMREDAPLPPLRPLVETQLVAELAAPAEPEPKRYTLGEAVALIAQYGSLAAAEAASLEQRDDAQG